MMLRAGILLGRLPVQLSGAKAQKHFVYIGIRAQDTLCCFTAMNTQTEILYIQSMKMTEQHMSAHLHFPIAAVIPVPTPDGTARSFLLEKNNSNL